MNILQSSTLALAMVFGLLSTILLATNLIDADSAVEILRNLNIMAISFTVGAMTNDCLQYTLNKSEGSLLENSYKYFISYTILQILIVTIFAAVIAIFAVPDVFIICIIIGLYRGINNAHFQYFFCKRKNQIPFTLQLISPVFQFVGIILFIFYKIDYWIPFLCGPILVHIILCIFWNQKKRDIRGNKNFIYFLKYDFVSAIKSSIKVKLANNIHNTITLLSFNYISSAFSSDSARLILLCKRIFDSFFHIIFTPTIKKMINNPIRPNEVKYLNLLQRLNFSVVSNKLVVWLTTVLIAIAFALVIMQQYVSYSWIPDVVLHSMLLLLIVGLVMILEIPFNIMRVHHDNVLDIYIANFTYVALLFVCILLFEKYFPLGSFALLPFLISQLFSSLIIIGRRV